MEAALPALSSSQQEQRAETLVELSIASHWLQDVPSTRRYASEALLLAERMGRADLAAGAMSGLALADSSDGELEASLRHYESALARSGGLPFSARVSALEMSALILYWRGRFGEAVTRAREAIERGRVAGDTANTARALGNLGLALTATGQYDEALRVFEEGQRLAREHALGTWLARATSMRGGLHLEVFDFEGAEALADEGREMGRSIGFGLAVVSCGIDLLLNFTRRSDVGRAEKLLDEVADGVRKGTGAHGWLWRLRFALARAEMALERGDREEALRWAEDTIAQSLALGRVKYQVAGLRARGQALVALARTHEAIAALRSAVELARTLGDPATFLRAASSLLPLAGDGDLAAEARAAANSIAAALPDERMRHRFLDAEPVRLLGGLS
jgi:tetratricopeptide (TPR) repeat protein